MFDNFSQSLVIDSNIFIKVLQLEPDSQTAREFLSYCNQYHINLVAPILFRYEVANVCVKNKVDMTKILALLDIYLQHKLTLVEPNRDEWLLAEKICQNGHEKSGYPSMYDSIYHALAIQRNTIFVTADNRHLVKAKQHGSIILLNDWQTLFDDK